MTEQISLKESDFTKEVRNTFKQAKTGSKFIAKYVGVPLLALATIYGTFHSTETEQLKAKGYSELNTVVYNRKGSSKGIVLGVVNTVYGEVNGLEIGIFNSGKNFLNEQEGMDDQKKSDNILIINKGAQISIVSEATSLEKAVQLGVVDFSDSTNKSAQVGVINLTQTLGNSAQVGGVNYTESTEGGFFQLSLFNLAKVNNGEGFYLQLGLWNTSEDRSTILINFGYTSDSETKTIDNKVEEEQ